MKKILIYLLILLFLMCNCQSKKDDSNKNNHKINTTVEKFDFQLFKKYQENGEFLKLQNGKTILSMAAPALNEIGMQEELLPKPSFYTIYKEFYPDGFLKKKEMLLGQYTKVGISEYYDEKGKLDTKNEDEKFGKIKPADVLKILDKKKIINLSTGEGRFDENGNSAFTITFDENKNEYTVTLEKGKANTNPEFGIGEPPAFIPVYYIIDGETGNVTEKQ